MIVINLFDAVAQGLGSTAAFMLPGVGVAKMAGLGRVGSALAFGASSGGIEGLSEGGSVFATLKSAGASDEEARSAARKVFTLQAPIDIATSALGAFIGGKEGAGIIRKALGRGTGELAQETFQGVTSDTLGARKPDGTPLTWGDVVSLIPEMASKIPAAIINEGVPAFISAALFGAGEGIFAKRQAKKESDNQRPPSATPPSVLPAQRGELIRWAKEEMANLTAAAQFDEGSDTATNALTDEQVQKFTALFTALKTHDYDAMARLREMAPTETQDNSDDGNGNGGGETPVMQQNENPNISTVSTSTGDTVQTRYKFAEANNLISSNTQTFGQDPRYPQELQPRQRDRTAGQLQVEGILSKLNPELLADNRLASDGAPIVGADNVVESGNGRTLALKLMYGRNADEQIRKYRTFLRDNAARFGLNPADIDTMRAPVLVRERVSDVDRRKFAQDANVSSVAAMSSTETAMRDAQKMSDGILGAFNPDVDFTRNADFVNAFIREVVPQNEIGAFIDAQGRLSQDGIRRMQNALFAAAYKDTRTLARMSEATDDNTRNINRALVQAAPVIATMQNKMFQSTLGDTQRQKRGDYNMLRPELSIADHVTQAANKLTQLREQGVKVGDYVGQQSFFSDADISPEAKKILAFMDKTLTFPN